jgi:hypothetical protein
MLLDESCFNFGNRIQCGKLNTCASVIRVVNLKYLLPELSNIFFCVLKVTSESVDDLVVVLYTGLDLENVRLKTENCKNLIFILKTVQTEIFFELSLVRWSNIIE